MDIIVCVKQVPDTTDVQIDSDTNNLVRDNIPCILNPYDEYAIEWGLKIRDQFGGKVTAVSMGPAQAEKELRRCLELGVDEAYLLTDRRFGGSDTLATGYVLSKWISKHSYDLILCGAEAIDGCTGHVGPSIAANLNIPQFTSVIDFSVKSGDIYVRRSVAAYYEEYSTPLPALLCIKKSNIKFMNRLQTEKPVILVDASCFDKERIGVYGSPTRVVEVSLTNKSIKSYVEVDYKWSCEDRIDYIIRGGIEPNQHIKLLRDTSDKLAEYLINEEMKEYIQ